MDHFKDFERESKTKRFSQVGLNKGDRADPNAPWVEAIAALEPI